DLSLCFGESLEVGNTTYTSSGMYTDILTSVEGCDSTVFTNLTILPELTVSVDINTEATAYLDPSGIAQVSPAGGAGNYIYQWSNGANTPLAANLEGGINYCVTVTDDAGCAAEDCVLMLFPSNIQTDLQDIILNCPGDTDGSLSLSVFNGVIPYNYQWQNASNSLNGSGTITTEGGVADIANLPQGTYSFTITDAFGETTATAQVNDPIPIITPLNETICFGESLVIGGSVYSTSTLVNETLTSFYGCDSVVAGILTVLPLNETIIDQTLCFGESLQVGTTTYSATGPINEVLQAFNGCDSLVSGVLTILPQISTSLTPEICFGDAFAVGTSSYNTSGTYVDVLPAANGCDSTIQTTLNVLAELSPVITQDLEASGLGAIDGVLSVQVSGGSGNFTYLWSDGQTSQQAIDLTGGTLYCVTITDDVGCSVDACQPVLFPVNIITDLENDTLDCIGTTDGLLSFSVSNGQAPYQYDWQNQDNSLNGNGMLDLEGGLVNINNLPAGAYTVTVSDPWGTTVISATVVEPEPIVIQIINPIDASCFGNCDAGATLQVNGGRAPYTYSWPNGESGVSTSNLCAGAHQVTITDALNCTALTDFTLNEPAEFIAQAMEVEPVNCFGGNDGQAVVTTNGTPIAYLWDTGETTELANQLSAGAHNVTITNFDNCTATTAVVISQPLASLSVDIFVENPISCASSSDGVLSASIVGGNGNESLAWSNGDLGMQARDLASGIYSLTITDNNGCTTTSSFNLEAPQAIAAQFQTVDVTCDGGENSGALLVEQVSGGVGPYLFSIDGNFFTADSVFVRMTAGNYDLAVEDAAGCIRIFPVLIAAPPVLQVQLGDDLDIALGETVELAPFSSSNNVLYQWSPDFNLTCDTCARQELIPTQSIDYMVQITDTLTNCIAEDAIRIEVRKDRRVYIPNAFSPNQDGVNDLLLIHGGTDVGLVWSFRIFNRWGAVVFERTNFPPNDDTYSWNGMHRGQLVDNGVYIFTAEVEFIDGKRIEYSGDVTIMR
ncbi:MAG: gliding motility-associated C-terminal domain-containing protein, partial [Bacteroidota bacterium]